MDGCVGEGRGGPMDDGRMRDVEEFRDLDGRIKEV
jgi:hypothetical protein